MYSSVDPSHVEPQSLTNNCWSLATLQLADEPLLLKMVELAASRITLFKPYELANFLWGLAKVLPMSAREKKSTLQFPVHAMFQAAANQIITQVDQFDFRKLATISWAFAPRKATHIELFQCVGARIVQIVGCGNPQEMSNTAWAFGTIRIRNDDLFLALANEAIWQLNKFKPQELSNMVWAFGTNGFFHEEFYARASVTVQHMNLQTQHLANIIWAYARARPHGQVTRKVINAMLPTCTKMLEMFKPQEVVAVAQAVAASCTADQVKDRYSHQCNSHILPTVVHGFFECVLSWAYARLPHLPARVVAEILSSLLVVDASGNLGLAPPLHCMDSNMLCLVDRLDPASLLNFLTGLASSPQLAESRITAAVYARLGKLIGKLDVQSFHKLGRIVAKELNCEPQHKFMAKELGNYCFLRAKNCQSDAEVTSTKLVPIFKESRTHCSHALNGLAEAELGQLTQSNRTESDAIDSGLSSVKPDSITEETLQSQTSARSKLGPSQGASRSAHAPTQQISNCEGRSETAGKLNGQEIYTKPFKQGTTTYMSCRISVKNSFFHIEDDDDDDDNNGLECRHGKDGCDRDASQRSTSAPSRTVSLSSTASFWWGFPCARQLPVVHLN